MIRVQYVAHQWDTIPTTTALFPGPCPAFHRLQYGKWGGPGTFPHMSDVKGRKTVERPK